MIQEEYALSGAPGALLTQGAGMLAPTLLEVGREDQKKRFIARALTGEDVWCQGYSEPGAGSDLASLASRAELVGGEWVIHGHKIWTSGADKADYMFDCSVPSPTRPSTRASHTSCSTCASPASRCGRCAR